jgi:thiamine-monophosphate kinase
MALREFDFIRWIQSQQTGGSGSVRVGAGDDLAVLSWNADDLLIVGVDQVLDGVHFDSQVHSPHDIGRKVMNRNLSDCAAMAALPVAAVATVALPPNASMEYAQALYAGMREAGEAFGCPIVGGDTGSWPGKLVMTVTILGRSAGIAPITRSGAKPGDGIYVTGPLGGSIFGRHLNFTPRIHEARQLAATSRVTAMMDISDGLSRDLPHICRMSGVGAVIDADAVPVHTDAVELSRRDGKPPLEHALHDGEDHELLVTVQGDPLPGLIRIGTVVSDPGVWIQSAGQRQTLPAKGWEHGT